MERDSMCKIHRILMRIYRAIKITSYCSSTYLHKIKQLQTN